MKCSNTCEEGGPASKHTCTQARTLLAKPEALGLTSFTSNLLAWTSLLGFKSCPQAHSHTSLHLACSA
eukprot:scaffold9480_cov15-Tisochrysis_lutea.AAC.1